MTKRMLIDTTHAEETRVVVLDGNRLDDYDVETSSKKQLKGNIYLAKIVRIEPSLQAAFVEYGGNRHGFLAFSEIHPDYYQIPVADRERLIALQEEEARAEEARADSEDDSEDEAPAEARSDASRQGRQQGRRQGGQQGGTPRHETGFTTPDQADDQAGLADQDHGDAAGSHDGDHDAPQAADRAEASEPAGTDGDDVPPIVEMSLEIEAETIVSDSVEPAGDPGADADGELGADPEQDQDEEDSEPAEPPPETVGGESPDDGHAQRRTARFLRQYKIQEVMRRRQILLIQVVKEERGNKGAALTTYISLAGRFCVLMPNSLRGGGVSRKITSAADRRRLKEITNELDIPRGMGMIVRTAGAQRPRPEIRRDCEYLLRTWDEIRETTMASIAPCLVYEEASLIKRAIRDVYTRDVEEIVVDGEAGWKGAREFMRTLMPANASKVNLWRDSSQTLFSHYQVEHHLDAMLQPTVQLKSGGYLVINQTEALVAIDVNSGRSTRERSVEETAFRTNIEASDEVARQLRLRDLAGLIVIDFIDMEVRRNNAAVERRLKDALRNDRARIQVGSISHFGLMEMSRQRLRPSIAESSFVSCSHCGGTGFMRGTESSALHVLRAIEEEAGKRKAAEILVHVAGSVALYVLNQKRAWLREIETRHQLTVHLAADDTLLPPNLRIDRVRPYVAPAVVQPAVQQEPAPLPARVTQIPIETVAPEALEDEEATDDTLGHDERETQPQAAAGQAESEEAGRRRKRRRRRRGGRREDGQGDDMQADGGREADDGEAEADSDDMRIGTSTVAEEAIAPVVAADGEGSAPRGRRRRGGRNRNRTDGGGQQDGGAQDEERDGQADQRGPTPRAYVGPTPADPFAGSFDIFEMIERDAEEPMAVMRDPSASAASYRPVPEPLPKAVMQEPGPEPKPEPLAESGPKSGPVEEPLAEPVAAVPAEAVTDPVSAGNVETTEAAAPKPRKPRASRARKPAAATDEAPDVVSDAAAHVPETVAEPVAAVPTRAARKPRARSKAAPVVEAEPEPVAEPDVTSATTLEAMPESAAATVDPSIVQPKVIGETMAPASRRTGWWKR